MNHLNEIRLNSNVVGQNFTPGNQNPADFCARYSILKDSKRWFYGPEQSNQFIKPGESKINIDDIDLEYSYLENSTKSCRKLSKDYIQIGALFQLCKTITSRSLVY